MQTSEAYLVKNLNNIDVLKVENKSPPSIPSPLKNVDFLPEIYLKYRHIMLIYIIFIYAQIDKNTHILINMCCALSSYMSLGYLFSRQRSLPTVWYYVSGVILQFYF